jgi:phage/plasmid-associated DNA primase
MLKSLSGGDTVPGEFKGRDSFDFVNAAKIIIATNALPETTDKTEGFYRRWMIIDFCNKFSEGKDVIDEIPQWEYENLALKSIGILRNLLNEGKFHNEGSVSDRAAKYEAKSNPLNKFIDDNCTHDINEKIPYWFLYERYIDHCKDAGHRVVTKKEFTTKLKNIGFETKQSKFNRELVRQYRNSESEEDFEPSNWLAIFGIAWDWGRQGSQSRQGAHSISPIGEQSEYMSTSSTSTTSQQNVDKISLHAHKFEQLNGAINHTNLVDATHTISGWIKVKPSEVRQVLEKLCKLSSILDEDNAESL